MQAYSVYANIASSNFISTSQVVQGVRATIVTMLGLL